MILFINACVRDDSRTSFLAHKILNKINDTICEADLSKMSLKSLDRDTLDFRNECCKNCDFSNEFFDAAKVFKTADEIIIAAPYWDLSFPSSVKVYIENIMVSGLTFDYDENGRPYSLCKAKKLTYVSTAGGSTFGENEGYRYIKLVMEVFYGIHDFKLIQAENLDIIGADVNAILDNVSKNIECK